MAEVKRDPDLEWLDHVQQVGLVVAPVRLKDLGLAPERQTQVESKAITELIGDDATKPALSDAWPLFERVLGWQAQHVAGSPGGPPLPQDLQMRLPEHETTLAPTWAVAELGGGPRWQLLARIEATGVDPDARGALGGWEATPHQRFERLLRETGVFAGVLVTERRERRDGEDRYMPEVRLVYAPSGETSGYLTFPLRALGTVAGRPMLGGLKLLLDSVRLFTDADERRLPALLKASRDAQAAVSTELAGQVLGALHELLRGLDAAEPTLIREIARSRSGHLYEGLLTVLMRLVFVLYAEDRDLLPSRTDGRAKRIYETSYSVRGLYARLAEDAALNPDTMDERRGGWGRLLALFRLIHAGHRTHLVQARGGKLFDPEQFPFLEGRAEASDPRRVPAVSDGCLLRILEGLMTLAAKGGGRERLSYRALDVEQIGSVYETVMGFKAERAAGRVLAIKAGKHNRTPVFVDLDELLAVKGKDRLKSLKEESERGQLAASVAKAVEAAKTVDELAVALDPIVDERGSPKKHAAAADTPILQPTGERRRTGSHYTPRSLTQPIVKYALEPAFERLGPQATPEQILDLKVCDPAMGSGAFLVEACRAIAARLVEAWGLHKDKKPIMPSDEDEELHARRLVVQRCIYGVDKNPLAVDLAKLSLWLATLARDHEFTFLDHLLKSGDSLVGLTRAQIEAAHWDLSRDSAPLLRGLLRERVNEVAKGRHEIQFAPDGVGRAIQEARNHVVETKLEGPRLYGNALVASFFAADSSRQREAQRVEVAKLLMGGDGEKNRTEKLAAVGKILGEGLRPIPPFHWEIEFPEVFMRGRSGFDAIIGNPPFLGGKRISTELGRRYRDWLEQLHSTNQNVDLVGHFFRRAFQMLAENACLGLVATNTIAQGATREGTLLPILTSGGSIARVIKRIAWPGDAAVVVSILHVVRGAVQHPVINGKVKHRISSYLIDGELDSSPSSLAENADEAFVGSYLLGMGFTFDDEAAAKGEANSLECMRELITRSPQNARVITPFLGGDEINSSPKHEHHRYTINFQDFPLERKVLDMKWASMDVRERSLARREGIVPLDYSDPVASDWPELLEIVRILVKPVRDRQARPALKKRWWQFAEKQKGLYSRIGGLRLVIGAAQTSKHISFTFLPIGITYSHKTIIFVSSEGALFGVLQSRVHQLWAHQFGSTMKDDPVYTPSDCFETYPFPLSFESDPRLGPTGGSYHAHRAALMTARNEGMTGTYNRFHNPSETADDIQRLRELQVAMDRVVLEAYGWRDLAERAVPIFLDETNEDDHTYQGRLFWPSDFRDEVLARLLALNAERHAEEVRLGIAPGMKGKAGEDTEEGLEDR